MIKFKCGYCGKEIQAANKDAGVIVKCANCLQPQPAPTPFHQKIQEAREKQSGIEPDMFESPLGQLENELEAEEPETEEIEDYSDEPDDGFLSSISLQFSEASLFAMSLVFLILCSIDKQMQDDLRKLVMGICGKSNAQRTLGIICIVLPFSLGMILSVYHALIKKEKGYFEKALMLFFAVIISAGTGVYMSIYLFMTGVNVWLMIFAACNIIYCALLLFKFEWAVIGDDLDGNHISDRNANLYEIIFTTMTVFVVLFACWHMFELHWVIVYSICITYITAVNAGIASVFRGRW